MTDGSYQPPGWYHGEGDPPATQRYWDGEMWVGDPVPVPTSDPPPPPATGGVAYGTAAHYPEKSKSTTVLITGIVGIVCCQFVSPVAWKMGRDELTAIDAGRRSPHDRGLAMTGMVLGIIGSLLLILVLLYAVAAIVTIA